MLSSSNSIKTYDAFEERPYDNWWLFTFFFSLTYNLYFDPPMTHFTFYNWIMEMASTFFSLVLSLSLSLRYPDEHRKAPNEWHNEISVLNRAFESRIINKLFSFSLFNNSTTRLYIFKSNNYLLAMKTNVFYILFK